MQEIGLFFRSTSTMSESLKQKYHVSLYHGMMTHIRDLGEGTQPASVKCHIFTIMIFSFVFSSMADPCQCHVTIIN